MTGVQTCALPIFAESIVYGALAIIKQKSGKDPIEVFSQALQNVKPVVEVKSRRVGGANYQVPVEVRPVRRQALAMRWLEDGRRVAGAASLALAGLGFAAKLGGADSADKLTPHIARLSIQGLITGDTCARARSMQGVRAASIFSASATAPSSKSWKYSGSDLS